MLVTMFGQIPHRRLHSLSWLPARPPSAFPGRSWAVRGRLVTEPPPGEHVIASPFRAQPLHTNPTLLPRTSADPATTASLDLVCRAG